MTTETIGKVASDLMLKSDHLANPGNVIELERAMQEDYLKNLLECFDASHKNYTGDFYIIVLTKREQLLENVMRNYFFSRATCPTPDYDQSVYQYNSKHGNLEYLWTVPSKDACIHFMEFAKDIAPQERQLLQYVLDFHDGTLDILSKKLNREEIPSAIIT